MRLWNPEPYRYCSYKPLLTRVKKTDDKAVLHIEDHLMPLYGENVSCCTSKIFREKNAEFPDDHIRRTQCEPFEQDQELDTDTIVVICRDGWGNTVYENTHFIIMKTDKSKKLSNNASIAQPISVLFIVIDSLSRLNFIRTMPKTRNYLLDNGFVEFRGYNKIDDNTFPNFVALQTGLNKQGIKQVHCTGKKVDELDNCPMIWHNFSTAGYVTAYGEDWGQLSTFNYFKKGFTKPPTDFYFRPYVIASESIGTFLLKGAPYCSGPETSGERQLDLALDFSKTFRNTPYFGIFWMNTFSHQSLNTPNRFDDKMREFFTNLKAERILEDSVVVLLSDHGIRMDKAIRGTFSGWFEERLPVNLISIPKWFRKNFPTETQNFIRNSAELTSTYDLYMTLQHILSISDVNYKVVPSLACPKCRSIFERIPTRSCSEAGISQEWCTCIGHMNYLSPSENLAINSAKFAIKYMQSQLNHNNHSDACNDLQLFYVKKAALSETSETANEKYLIVNFFTLPTAEFIVALKCRFDNEKQETKFDLLFDVIRLDSGFESCIYKSKFHQYCICKS